MSKVGSTYVRYNGDDRCAVEAVTGLGEVNSAEMDAEFNDFKGALNQIIWRDGSAAMTGNLDINSNQVLNLGTVTGSPTFTGGVTFDTTSVHNGGVSINGASTIVGNTTQVGNNAITGNLAVTGDISGDVDAGSLTATSIVCSDTLVTSGLATFNQGVTCNAALSVTTSLFSALAGIRINSDPPASSVSEGNIGTITWDTNYFYVCVDDDEWKRVELTSW